MGLPCRYETGGDGAIIPLRKTKNEKGGRQTMIDATDDHCDLKGRGRHETRAKGKQENEIWER